MKQRPHRMPYLGARVLAPCLYGTSMRMFPAVVTQVGPDYRVDLAVIYAGERAGASLQYIHLAEFEPDAMEPGTWRWPPHGE